MIMNVNVKVNVNINVINYLDNISNKNVNVK